MWRENQEKVFSTKKDQLQDPFFSLFPFLILINSSKKDWFLISGHVRTTVILLGEEIFSYGQQAKEKAKAKDGQSSAYRKE